VVWDDVPSFLTVAEVAGLFRIGRNTVYDLIRRGHLDGTRIGHTIRIRRSEVDRLLATRTGQEGGLTESLPNPSGERSGGHEDPTV
jgi:excisionase family DNA binding protein